MANTNYRDVILKENITCLMTEIAVAAMGSIVFFDKSGLVALGVVSLGVVSLGRVVLANTVAAETAALADAAAADDKTDVADFEVMAEALSNLYDAIDVAAPVPRAELAAAAAAAAEARARAARAEARAVAEARAAAGSLRSQESPRYSPQVTELDINENPVLAEGATPEEGATNRNNPIMAVFNAIMSFFSKMVNYICSFFYSTKRASEVSVVEPDPSEVSVDAPVPEVAGHVDLVSDNGENTNSFTR